MVVRVLLASCVSVLTLTGCVPAIGALAYPSVGFGPTANMLPAYARPNEANTGRALTYTGGIVRSVAPNIPGIWTVRTAGK